VESISADGPGATLLDLNDGKTPFACMNVLGRSVVARLTDQWKGSGISAMSVFVTQRVPSAGSLWRHAAERLSEYQRQGLNAVLLAQVGAYAEIDVEDMCSVHEKSGKGVTRAFDGDGPLNLWVVDPKRFLERESLFDALYAERHADYQVRGYVNRLGTLQDVRSLVTDGLSRRCHFQPQGHEVKPGIWMDASAQVERSARVVAPAFIGRDARIADECLITRGTNIESDSIVDFGTAVEDSSVLSGSYVGIGLDLSHSIVDGNTLFNFCHNVTLRISDPFVMRRNDGRNANGQLSSDFETGEMILSSTEELAQ